MSGLTERHMSEGNTQSPIIVWGFFYGIKGKEYFGYKGHTLDGSLF